MQTLETQNRTQVQLSPAITAMLERADNLHADGYYLSIVDADTVTIHTPPISPGRFAPRYTVNLRLRTCDCQSFCGGQFRQRDGRRTCKHLAGALTLAHDCEVACRAFYLEVAAELNGRADAHQRRAVHMGATLCMAFGKSDRNQVADNSKRSADALRGLLKRFAPIEKATADAARRAA